MAEPCTVSKPSRAGTKRASLTLTPFIQQVGITEHKYESGAGCRSFQHFKISEMCADSYGEYDEFCRVNMYILRKTEKFGNDVYVQFGAQTNIHAQASNFVQNIVSAHNAAHLKNRVDGHVGGCSRVNDDDFQADFSLSPIEFPPQLGPTVVGEVYSTHPVIQPNSDSPIISCARKVDFYLRQALHVSAVLCVEIEYPWPVHGYPQITLYYYALPDLDPFSVHIQPRRIVNIGRVLTDTKLGALTAMYPNLDHTNMFGNGFGGCGDCHPAADPAHYVFEIPGTTALYIDTDHTKAAGNVAIEDVNVGIEVDCRILLSRIILGAEKEGFPVHCGSYWPWNLHHFL